MTLEGAPVDPQDVVGLSRFLIDIPSVTGQEGAVMERLEQRLSASGWPCRRQPVEEGRFNLWCCDRARPRLILSTHLDTVPPFFPSREDAHYLYGRGSCDAKGIAAAMICAAQQLRLEGASGIALLFLVGEETDSAGARVASATGIEGDFLINGEPTENELVSGHKGVVSGRLEVVGKTAHSAYPEQGVSAIDRLVEILSRLKRLSWPTHPTLGDSHLNIGRIRGGEAPNVVAGQAEADILIRTVAPASEYTSRLAEVVGTQGEVHILKTTEPQSMLTLPGFKSRVVSYSTDIPALRPIARPLLVGPGNILEAHTADEKILKQDLTNGVLNYYKLATILLSSNPSVLAREDPCSET